MPQRFQDEPHLEWLSRAFFSDDFITMFLPRIYNIPKHEYKFLQYVVDNLQSFS